MNRGSGIILLVFLFFVATAAGVLMWSNLIDAVNVDPSAVAHAKREAEAPKPVDPRVVAEYERAAEGLSTEEKIALAERYGLPAEADRLRATLPVNPMGQTQVVVGSAALLMALVAGGWLVFRARQAEEEQTGQAATMPGAAHTIENPTTTQTRVPVPGDDLRRIRDRDPLMSVPATQLAVHRAYSALIRGAVGGLEWDDVAPFVRPEARDQLITANADVAELEELAVTRIDLTLTEVADALRLEARVEAFRQERTAHDEDRTLVTYDRLLFVRPLRATSVPISCGLTLGCGSCKARFELDSGGRCVNCATHYGRSAQPWQLTQVLQHETWRPKAAPLEVQLRAQHANLASLRDPACDADIAGLVTLLGSFDPALMVEHCGHVLVAVLEAEREGTLEPVRGCCTDAALDAVRSRYRTRAFLQQDHHQEDPEMLSHEFVLVERDADFTAITLRLRWKMRDYVVDANGELVDGSPDDPVVLSEYWTMLRRGPNGSMGTVDRCSACGAEAIAIEDDGTCAACNSYLADGQHGWVLHRRESVAGWHRIETGAAPHRTGRVTSTKARWS